MTTRLNDTPNSRKLTADEELRNLEKPLIIKHQGFQKIYKPNYNPVVMYSPSHSNPNYKSRPILPC
mgnify:FL=1|jgi:hypothetical protein